MQFSCGRGIDLRRVPGAGDFKIGILEVLATTEKKRSTDVCWERTDAERWRFRECAESVSKLLACLNEMGLAFAVWGSRPTLSGGRRSALKLAAHLTRSENQASFYILREPTTGLHFDDIANCWGVSPVVESGASLW